MRRHPDADVEGLDDAGLLDLHRSMVLLRTYDERSLTYHRQGRIGTYAIFWGTEAIQAGSVHALEARRLGVPVVPRVGDRARCAGWRRPTILAWWRGHPAGWWDPRERKVASICVPIATHVPHAAGLAWGLRLRGERSCAVCYFGDGATSEGAFHEGANFAAVMDAPLVLLCNNNGWAISTPLDAQTRAATLADKAAGYGMPGVRVDGGDVLAVYDATREAVARARAGEGPTLIEAVTYRMAPHATADDPSLYIDEARVAEERRERVPRSATRATCAGRGILTDELAEAVRADALAAMREGIAAAEALPAPDPALVFDTAYADPPPRLAGRARRAAAHPRRGRRMKTLVEAVNDGLHTEMARDASVMVHGRGRRHAGRRLPRDRRPARPVRARPLRRHAARRGGHPRCGGRPRDGGLSARAARCSTTPSPTPASTSSSATSAATGGAPAARWSSRSPCGCRTAAGVRAPELHDDSPEAYYVHTPGIKVAIPSTPADAKGLLAAAIRDADPVVILEPKLIYRTARGEVPEGEHVVPLGKARIARAGRRRDRRSPTARWWRWPRRRPTGPTRRSRCSTCAR